MDVYNVLVLIAVMAINFAIAFGFFMIGNAIAGPLGGLIMVLVLAVSTR